MSNFSTFEYVLPEFTAIDGYDGTGLVECVTEVSATLANGKERLLEVAKTFPWVRELLPTTNVWIEAHSIKAEMVPEIGYPFRAVGWHTDRQAINDGSFNERIGLLATSTPTTFASCKIVVDNALAKELRIYGNPASLTNLDKLGPTWLQQATGFAPLEDLGGATVKDLIKEVSDFRSAQADPGVFAMGAAEQTLHTASFTKPGDPLKRVLIGIRYLLLE